jgi:imidazolonepropionase-like amidohydrolase
VHREMELLAEAGLGAAGALKAATINPARSLERTKDFGAVQPGKMADLVLLEGNPLVDIRNTRRIRAVVLKGHLYTRDQLNAMLERLQRPQ